MTRKSICIISFSPIHQDGRVLRQVKYLAPHYDLTVIGYGQPHPTWQNMSNINWVPIARKATSLTGKLIERALSLLSRVRPSFYENIYWRQAHYGRAFERASADKYDAFHANEWKALPVAARAASRNGARLVFDAHEWEEQPYRKYPVQKYAEVIDASTTVTPPIAERYSQEFGLNPLVVLNVPERVPLPARELDPHHIRLIHHGAPKRGRRLELMIQTLALCDQRYHLHFMLLPQDPGYIQELKEMANELAPGRVVFHNPVPPDEIVPCVAEYDMGICLFSPLIYSVLVALPNKFFEYIAAGLAVCIGPSPAMAEIVNKYGLGCAAPTFEPGDVAELLNRLTVEQLATMRRAARWAAEQLNAEKEMGKVVELYGQLLMEA